MKIERTDQINHPGLKKDNLETLKFRDRIGWVTNKLLTDVDQRMDQMISSSRDQKIYQYSLSKIRFSDNWIGL